MRKVRSVAYTPKVPETVSVVDLTADSISKGKLTESSSRDWVEACDFQSASKDDEGFGSSSLVPPDNQPCIFELATTQLQTIKSYAYLQPNTIKCFGRLRIVNTLTKIAPTQ